MTERQRLQIARNILNNATEINISKGLLLRISQKTDEYIVKYISGFGKPNRTPEELVPHRSAADTP